MNEVSSSRICLLNARRKSEYDAKLRSRVDSQTAPVPPPHEMLSPALEERRDLEQPRSRDPLQTAPSRRLRPANLSNTSRGLRHGKFRRSAGLGSESIKRPLVLGGVAAIAVVLIMLWLVLVNGTSRPKGDVAGGERVAESSIVAKLERERQTTAPGSPRVVPNTQPPPPPVPLVPQEDVQTSNLGQPGDNKSTDTQDTAESARQDSLGPESKPDVGGGRGAVIGSDAGDDQSPRQNQPLAPLDPRSGNDVRVDDASTRDGPQLNGQHERIGLERSAGGLAPANPPRRVGITSTPVTVTSTYLRSVRPVWRLTSIACRANSIFLRRSQQRDRRVFVSVNCHRLKGLIGKSCWKTTRHQQVNRSSLLVPCQPKGICSDGRSLA